MATYTSQVIGVMLPTDRVTNRPTMIISADNMDVKNADTVPIFAQVLSTDPPAFDTTNNKVAKQGYVASSDNMSPVQGTTIVISGVKPPRTSPLEIRWKQSNK